MLRKKVCLIGAPGVGKTSLVRRFVDSMFSDEYLSTVGVKIDRRSITVDSTELTLMVWDIHGEEGPLRVLPSYLQGAAGYVLVVDSTRVAETAHHSGQMVGRPELASLPYVLATNKTDLATPDLTDVSLAPLAARSIATIATSAKTGAGVEDAFASLARAVIA